MRRRVRQEVPGETFGFCSKQEEYKVMAQKPNSSSLKVKGS